MLRLSRRPCILRLFKQPLRLVFKNLTLTNLDKMNVFKLGSPQGYRNPLYWNLKRIYRSTFTITTLSLFLQYRFRKSTIIYLVPSNLWPVKIITLQFQLKKPFRTLQYVFTCNQLNKNTHCSLQNMDTKFHKLRVLCKYITMNGCQGTIGTMGTIHCEIIQLLSLFSLG